MTQRTGAVEYLRLNEITIRVENGRKSVESVENV